MSTEEKVNLNEIARDLFDEVERDFHKAMLLLLDLAKEDEAVQEAVLYVGTRYTLNKVIHKIRQEGWTQGFFRRNGASEETQAPSEPSQARIRGLTRQPRDPTLMNMVSSTKKALGTMTKREIRAEKERLQTHGLGTLRNARFHLLIEQAMKKDSDIVGKVLSEDNLRRFMDRAISGVGAV